MSSFSRDDWSKRSWFNDMVSSPKFAKDLTSIYADDVIQSITEDQEFSTIEAAISDMRTRIGLSDGETGEIRRLATAMLNPKLQGAKERILNLPAIKLASLIKAYTTECDSCKQAPCDCTATLMKTVRQAMDELGLEALAELHDAKIAGKLPEGLRKWQEEHGKKSEDKADDCGDEKGEDCDDEEKEVAAAACGLKKTAASDPKEIEEAAKKTIKEIEEENQTKQGDNMNKKANVEKWNEFFKKKSWFQGSEEKVEKVVSNNPEQLGVPGAEEVYPRQNPPVGDVRNYEQKAFEGAAKATKPDLGPAGAELKEKERLQRAKWDAFMKKAGNK